MGWGEQHNAGAGTTGQVEDAHRALDAVQVRSGTLAVRALEAAGTIDRLRELLRELVQDWGVNCSDLGTCACSMARAARTVVELERGA